MPTVDQSFIYTGTNLTRGYADKEGGRAVVAVHVSDLPDTNKAKSDAIDTAISEVGQVYPHENSELPLASANANVWAMGKAWVTLNFHRTEADKPLGGAFNVGRALLFDERSKTTIEMWDADTSSWVDAPNDEWFQVDCGTDSNGNEITTCPRLRQNRDDKPIWQLTVPVVLTTNPEATVSSLHGLTNSDAVTIYGVTREANTLRYMGFRHKTIEKRSGRVYAGDHVFWWFPAGFSYEYWVIEERPIDPPDCEIINGVEFCRYTDTFYRVIARNSYSQTTFANQFPTHDGAGPSAV